MNCNRRLFYLYGLLVAFAYDDLSHNKFATQSHTWVGTGYDAANAVDGNPATCMRTMVIGLNSKEKTLWWKVDLGRVNNIYKVNIMFRNYEGYEIRQRGRFAGFSLYISNNVDIQGSNLCYKDGPQLPPLNFTTTCTKSGRYVIYYNERFNGVTYPNGYELINAMNELCEVTVQGCQNASVYGSNCNTPCPANCEDSTCHIQSGACFTCKPGWSGENCDTKCREGWYGINCSQRCTRHCRDGVTCNHVTGLCDRGCDSGWTGVRCDAECEDGTYGYNCVDKCSGHCLNDSHCNKQTGHCDEGCNPGYTNSYCSKECPPGRFGQDCREPCSSHCIHNEPCNHVSGECPSGCQDGFVGKNCNDACEKGYFGKDCSKVCSPNCKQNTCQHTDGSCTTCAPGWTGDNCTTEMGLKIQSSSCSILPVIGMTVSLLINLILIVCGILLCRYESIKMDVLGNQLPCWKRAIYQDTFVKTEEASTYQELDLPENTYQNTAIQ